MKTKIKVGMVFSLIISLLLGGCAQVEVTRELVIAVLGSSALHYPDYLAGIEQAVEDVNLEYANYGSSISVTYYDDENDYDKGSLVVDEIARSEAITAVLGSTNMEINQRAAHSFEKANKLFVVPFFIYDKTFEESNYKKVFSLCYSAEAAGRILRQGVDGMKSGRWAVCVGENEFEKVMADSFINSSASDGVDVVDCVDTVDMQTKFDQVSDRWEALGIEGVAIFHRSSNNVEILKKIKSKFPDMVIAGDTSINSRAKLGEDSALKGIMNGAILVDEFKMISRDSAEYEQVFRHFADLYEKKANSNSMSDWYFQGYNSVRLLADTAIKNETTSADMIAKKLHEGVYQGALQSFEFDAAGHKIATRGTLGLYTEHGNKQALVVDIQGE